MVEEEAVCSFCVVDLSYVNRKVSGVAITCPDKRRRILVHILKEENPQEREKMLGNITTCMSQVTNY